MDCEARLGRMGACLTVAVAIVVAGQAHAFSAQGGARVNPVTASVFEVVPRAGRSDTIWCGAADFARRQLGASWEDQLYVAREMGQSQTTDRRTAVQFTLDPASVGITPKKARSLNAFTVGDFMSVRQANMQCNRVSRAR